MKQPVPVHNCARKKERAYVVAVGRLVVEQTIDELYQLLRRLLVAMVTERYVGDRRWLFPKHHTNCCIVNV